MKRLSWNLRIVLGLVSLVIIAIIVFFAYYTLVRISRDGPIEVEVYRGAQLVNEEVIREGWDHQQYVSQAETTEGNSVRNHALAIEKFYRDRDYTCRSQYGDLFIDGQRQSQQYIQSSCLLDRSHSLGFVQEVEIRIQPEREPYTFENNDPNRPITGGGAATGSVIIDAQRQWGNVGLLGG